MKIKKYNPHGDECSSRCSSDIFTTEMIYVEISMPCCCCRCHGYHMGRTCSGNKILASWQWMHTTHHPVKPCTSGLVGSGCNTHPKDTRDIFPICMDDIWGQDRTHWEFFIPYGDHKHNWKRVNEQNLYVRILLFQQPCLVEDISQHWDLIFNIILSSEYADEIKKCNVA